MTEVEQPPQNGIDLSANEDDDNSKSRPADIEQDMREMERRKRVEAIMGSKLFREELERIVDSARDSGNADGILQQLSDIVGVPATRVGSVFKASNCMQPINDIRGVESMGYAKGEKILRCKLAATFRLLDLYGWTQGLGAQITARLKVDQEYFLVNPYGLLYHEITASSLNKVDMQGNIVEQGTTNFGVNKSHFVLHSVVHAARPDIRCAIYIGCSPVVAISSLKTGLLPLTKDACVLGEITNFSYAGSLYDLEERDKLVRNLGPNSKVMLLTNHGALCCGETIEEAFFAACHIVQACETQLKLLPVGLDNLVLIPEESRKTIYEQSRSPPEDLAKKFAAAVTAGDDSNKAAEEQEKKDGAAAEPANTKVLGQTPKWRVGGAEFEALMRMLDNAGYRTGYIYRHPLIKSEPPKPKNDVELPPAVSSLGYLLEEEELFRQGIWKKGAMGKGGDRSRWLNSPNVYQKVEVLETGTPDPKKITKWVAEGSPTHSTPVRIDDPLQFVPVNTNPKEFKRLQQQIKDNRRADKISAGPQSHILEGVTWDEANRIKDATVSQAGDHVVLMGAASKGIIQRGFQHNATVYKAPYAKNPFDNVTDDELNEYKRTVERKKKSIHGEYTDTDFSESEALSSLQTSGAQQQTKQNTTTTTTTAAVSQSEPEDISEHQVMRIETQQAPVPSQPEVVLSDATLSFINGERSHTATNRKPPTGRDALLTNKTITQDPYCNQESIDLTDNQSITLTLQPPCEQMKKKKKNHHHHDSHKEDHNANLSQCRHVDENSKPINNQTSRHVLTDINNPPNTSFALSNHPQMVLVKEMQTDALFQNQKRKVHQHTLTPIPKRKPPPPLPPTSINNSNTSTTTCYYSGNDNIIDKSLYSTPWSASMSTIYSNNSEEDRNGVPSLKSPNQDHLSYYTSAYLNSSQQLLDDLPPFYDYPNVSAYNLLPKKHLKSPNCYTPENCEQILGSLKKPPAHLHEHYLRAQSSLDLIWNIPVRRNYSPSSSRTPELLKTPTRKASERRQSRSPYRTLSHFGFKSPLQQTQPDHKHIFLPKDSKRYVPLRRSVSYEEIFSSPRYLDLCEHCFEQVVRFKPELMQYRIKLGNLVDSDYPRTTSKSPKQDLTNNEVIKTASKPNNWPETHDETNLSIFTCQLEPLAEVEEKDSSSDNSTTFLDKIMRMNYSEISTNNFFNSPQTKKLEEEQHMEHEDELTMNLRNLNIDDDNEIAMENEKHFVNISEILEFGDFINENVVEPHDGTFINKDCETQTDDVVDQKTETRNSSTLIYDSSPPPHELQRSLMNREERTRRKLEFQELWEDHVRYFEDRERLIKTVGSDTESAIDETQHSVTGREPPNPSENINIPNINKETFDTQSFIYMPHRNFNKPQQTTGGDNGGYQLEEDDVKSSSSSSKLTYNISEATTSEENLLNPCWGFTNILDNFKGERVTTEIDFKARQEPFSLESFDEKDAMPRRRSSKSCAKLESKDIGVDVTINRSFNQEKSSNSSKLTFIKTSEEKEIGVDVTIGRCDECFNQEKYSCSSKLSFIKTSEENPLNRSLASTNILENYKGNDEINDRETTEIDFKTRQEPFSLESFDEKDTMPRRSFKSCAKLGFNQEKSSQTSAENLLNRSLASTNILENYKENVDSTSRQQEQFSPESFDEKDTKQINSSTSFVKPNPPESEYLLFRSSGSKDSAVDLTIDRSVGCSNQEIIKYIDDDDDVIILSSSSDDEENETASYVPENKNPKDLKNIENLREKEKIEILDVQVIQPLQQTNLESSNETPTTTGPLIRYKSRLLYNSSEDNQTNIKNSQNKPIEDHTEFEDDDHSKVCENFDEVFKRMSCLQLKDMQIYKPTDLETQEMLKIKDNTMKPRAITENDKHFTKFPQNLQPKSNDNNIFEEHKQTNLACPEAFLEAPSLGNCNKENVCSEQKEIYIKYPQEDIQHKSKVCNISQESRQIDLACSEETFTQNKTSQDDCNKENESAEQLTSMEKEILEKIEFHQLNKTEEIFNKIENSIRNKITPNKLEMLIKEQWLTLYQDDGVESSKLNQLATPPQLPKILPEVFSLTPSNKTLNTTSRRSRSLTPLNDNANSPPSKLNKTTTPNLIPCQKHYSSPEQQRTPSPCLSSNSNSSNKCRNFILENIRNAAIPRHTPQIKRLQGNAQAIFCKNPFGPPKASESVNPLIRKSSSKSIGLKSPSKNSLGKTISSPACATNVYTFQSKLVRGSPRFWVSLTQSPRGQRTPTKTPTPPVSITKSLKRKDNQEKRASCKLNINPQLCSNTASSSLSSMTLKASKDQTLDVVSHVDAEINALGKEIQQIQPRLENYKRKLDDFGDRVAKCARNMDECIATQEEIISEHCELQEHMMLQQYVDNITCRVQTFSLSETED